MKAVLGLAKYVVATEESDQESALEELRDLSLEIEGDDIEAEEREKGFVRVLAGTAFARAGEIEEALETLGGTGTRENLEAYAQLYLSTPFSEYSSAPIVSRSSSKSTSQSTAQT